MNWQLPNLKPLTSLQYDDCRARALKRVQTRIGERPTRRAYVRELGSAWNVLDVLSLLVFASALTISSIHILIHVGQLATRAYSTQPAGVTINSSTFVAAHQLATIPLSEASMLLFTVLFAMSPNGWRRFIFLTLAAIATLFVWVANLSSGVGVLESAMPPTFTLGLGLRLEALIVASLKRRDEVNTRYLSALHTWEAASADATQHPDYLPLLRQSLWEKLASLPSNRDFRDAPLVFRAHAVARELKRDTWARDADRLVKVPLAGSDNQTEIVSGGAPYVEHPSQQHGEPGVIAVQHAGNGHIDNTPDVTL